jgi:hypothetical protein
VFGITLIVLTFLIPTWTLLGVRGAQEFLPVKAAGALISRRRLLRRGFVLAFVGLSVVSALLFWVRQTRRTTPEPNFDELIAAQPAQSIRAVLDPLPISKSIKAEAWNNFYASTSQTDFTDRFTRMKLAPAVSATLWHLRFGPDNTPTAQDVLHNPFFHRLPREERRKTLLS